MQKQTVLTALAAFACTAALAQAPANNTARPPSEVNPTASGGVAASAAQNKVDQRASRSTAAPADPAAGNGRAAPGCTSRAHLLSCLAAPRRRNCSSSCRRCTTEIDLSLFVRTKACPRPGVPARAGFAFW